MIKLIKFPYSRLDVDGSFEHLSNPEEQKEYVKNNHNYPYPYWSWLLYYVLDAIYGDYDLDKYNPEHIGETFYDEHEAQEVYKFCNWFHDLIAEIGENKPDSAYLNHPKWPKVIEDAKRIYELIQQNNEKYDYGTCLSIFNDMPFEEWEKKFE
jgi:hypothetical protein